jgi:SAM-dependent methyltransferase
MQTNCAILAGMDEEVVKLLSDLHTLNYRQGPGSKEAFQKMLSLSELDRQAELQIADIGCGTGSSTLPLLENTNAHITAVDLLPSFVEKLSQKVAELGYRERVTTTVADMSFLPFEKEQFDAIWSEGSIYNIGFSAGVKGWKDYLKPGGILVVSEITWLTAEVPEPLRNHWHSEFPEIATASEKIAVLENSGYSPIGYFHLEPRAWLDNYYYPLEASFDDFLKRNNYSESAKEIIEAEKAEIALYKNNQAYISYGVYIAKKVEN